MTTERLIGNTVEVNFANFGQRVTTGKVDTGATTSSLHADQIRVNDANQTVSFVSNVISPNVVTLALKGVQEVHSADNGGKHRPTVELDVVIDGVSIDKALFNLNDRGSMDTPVLIGQNILQAGGFIIDPSKPVSESSELEPELESSSAGNRNEIAYAIEVLRTSNMTIGEIIDYIQTASATQQKD